MKKFAKEFREFIAKGDVMSMAVGIIIGGAFTAIVNALSNNILRPIINWIIAAICGTSDLSKIYTVLKPAYVLDETGAVANTVTALSKEYSQVDAIHYPTQFLRDLYEGMYGPTNGYVISNGVNASFKPCPVQKPQEYQGKFVIVATGRYSKEKNQEVLLKAANLSRHRERLQVILAGSGPKEKRLRALGKKHHIPTPVNDRLWTGIRAAEAQF